MISIRSNWIAELSTIRSKWNIEHMIDNDGMYLKHKYRMFFHNPCQSIQITTILIFIKWKTPTSRANAAMVLRRKPNDRVRDHSSYEKSRSEKWTYQKPFRKSWKEDCTYSSNNTNPSLSANFGSISHTSIFGSYNAKKKGPSSNALDIIDIHLEWDGDADLRQRLLDGGSVMAPGPCCEDISTCLKNRALLAPILTKMASHESRKVPPIDSLVDEILRLLGRAKRGPETENQSDVISKSSSAIKKLCGFVKMKCRRREVSTVTGTQICRIRIRGFTGCRFLYL